MRAHPTPITPTPPPLHVTSGSLVVDRRLAWADALIGEGDAEAAAALLAETAAEAPNFAPLWFTLGAARAMIGDRDGAVAAYGRAESLDPDDRLGAGFRRARLEGRSVPMSAAFVRTLFDQYAERFDAHLGGALGYRGPEVLGEAIRAVAGPTPRFPAVLDMGCGTGLMAPVLRPWATQLAGVDLSPRMVAAARRTGLYDRLDEGDAVAMLTALPPDSLALAVAADVVVYLGDLGPLFRAAARALAPGGLLALTAQQQEGEGYGLGGDDRFHHSASYLANELAAANLRAAAITETSTRLDRGRPVPGLVVVAARR